MCWRNILHISCCMSRLCISGCIDISPLTLMDIIFCSGLHLKGCWYSRQMNTCYFRIGSYHSKRLYHPISSEYDASFTDNICDYQTQVLIWFEQGAIIQYMIRSSRTPKQTPHFDTRSEIYPSLTLVKMK